MVKQKQYLMSPSWEAAMWAEWLHMLDNSNPLPPKAADKGIPNK